MTTTTQPLCAPRGEDSAVLPCESAHPGIRGGRKAGRLGVCRVWNYGRKRIDELGGAEIPQNLPLVSADVVVRRRRLQAPRRRLDQGLLLDRGRFRRPGGGLSPENQAEDGDGPERGAEREAFVLRIRIVHDVLITSHRRPGSQGGRGALAGHTRRDIRFGRDLRGITQS